MLFTNPQNNNRDRVFPVLKARDGFIARSNLSRIKYMDFGDFYFGPKLVVIGQFFLLFLVECTSYLLMRTINF
jgi:hypothetical protein